VGDNGTVNLIAGISPIDLMTDPVSQLMNLSGPALVPSPSRFLSCSPVIPFWEIEVSILTRSTVNPTRSSKITASTQQIHHLFKTAILHDH